MRIEVELHPDVREAIRTNRWPPELVRSFFARVEEVAVRPMMATEGPRIGA
jgi:hypothetical protein